MKIPARDPQTVRSGNRLVQIGSRFGPGRVRDEPCWFNFSPGPGSVVRVSPTRTVLVFSNKLGPEYFLIFKFWSGSKTGLGQWILGPYYLSEELLYLKISLCTEMFGMRIAKVMKIFRPL